MPHEELRGMRGYSSRGEFSRKPFEDRYFGTARTSPLKIRLQENRGSMVIRSDRLNMVDAFGKEFLLQLLEDLTVKFCCRCCIEQGTIIMQLLQSCPGNIQL